MFNFTKTKKYNVNAVDGWMVLIANKQLMYFEKDAIMEEDATIVVLDTGWRNSGPC